VELVIVSPVKLRMTRRKFDPYIAHKKPPDFVIIFLFQLIFNVIYTKLMLGCNSAAKEEEQ